MTGNNATEMSEDDLATIVGAIIPRDMRVTPPAEFRAYVFRTEICDRLRGFGFEPRFWADGLLDHTTPKTRESRQAYVLAKTLGYLRGCGAIVALTGDRGVGKTTIAAQLAIRRLWEDWHSRTSGGPVLHRITSYRKLTAIVGRLKALYGDFGTIGIETLEAIRDHLASVELLVIDELNECADDSRHKDRILTDLIDRRYAANRDTILLTNQRADEFERTINPSVLSRLNEHGAIIPCEWGSFREGA
jgi:DNA replication protein DnaC